MLSSKDFKELKERIFKLLKFESDVCIEQTEFDGVKVVYDGVRAQIGFSTRSQLSRGLFLLAKELSAGKKTVFIEQKPKFKELGILLQLQIPMTVDGIVNYMEHMSALGFNYILLYMETSYELKEYPFFGYMRGRYTKEELQRIDEEGEKLGIEVIPCIEMLGHLIDYLRWPEAAPVKEDHYCLLVDEEKSYQLIEAMIKTMKETFRTKKIHIGMDEAEQMGLVNYLKKHGYTDRDMLFNRHVERVKDICRKYELIPMMWSDHPFRMASNGGYYDPCVLSEASLKVMRDTEICFWDYYATDYERYDNCLKMHLAVEGAKTVFSGGIWILDEFIINMPHTLKASKAALEACLDNKIESVNATVWGSAGNTNLEQSILGLSIFSEYCYLGKECTLEDIYDTTYFLTKVTRRFIEAISEFQLGQRFSVKLGGRLIWSDILYGSVRFNVDYDDVIARFERAISIMEQENPQGDFAIMKEYGITAMKAGIMKSRILKDIRKRYAERDMAFLGEICDKMIPELLPVMERVFDIKEELWERSTKPFGIEQVQIVYAGIDRRLKYAQKKIRSFINGEIESIPELEQEVLDEGYNDWLLPPAHMSVIKTEWFN